MLGMESAAAAHALGGASLDPGGLVPLVFGGGGALAMALLVLALLLGGKLHTHGEMERTERTLDKCEAASAEKDRVIEIARARADTAVQSAELFASALVGHERRPGGM
jgi:hypothetical protein